jgi:hypothetical protein
MISFCNSTIKAANLNLALAAFGSTLRECSASAAIHVQPPVAHDPPALRLALISAWAVADRKPRPSQVRHGAKIASCPFLQLTDIARPARLVRFVPILLQKSLCVGQHKFSGPCARRSNNHLRDYMFCNELTGDFGNGLEATSVGDCGSFGLFAGN